MVDTSQILQDIEAHNDICCQLLVVIQQENQWLSQDHTTDVPSPDQAVKRTLLTQLSQQVSLIQGHRVALKDHERVHPGDPIPKEVYSAIGRGTDLIMKMHFETLRYPHAPDSHPDTRRISPLSATALTAH